MPVERGFDRAELLQNVYGAFFTDARRARNIVHRIAGKCQVIDDEFGLDTHEILYLDGIVDDVVLGRVQHPDTIGDQLHHVLIAGHDDDVEALLHCASCNGADDVVRFVTGELQDRDVHGAQKLPHVGDLRGQVLRHFGAIGFVLGELFLPLGLSNALEDRRHVFGLEGLGEPADHVVEDEDRLGRDASRGAHGRRFGPGPGVIGTKDEAVGVDEKKTALH